MSGVIYFDDSLPAFAKLVRDSWGEAELRTNFFLRDISGRLTFVVLEPSRSQEERMALAAKAVELLGAFVDKDGFSVATPDELFDDSLRNPIEARRLSLEDQRFSGEVLLLDRRMIGADWLQSPVPASSAPARIVFASLKGGVGRSTALCVAAAHLAAQGRRVLAIDMDLEAPGLGNLLLPDDNLPEFGLLDYLVEQEVGNILSEQFYVDIVGPSPLSGGRGRIDVLPAIGARSLAHPSNVLAKISRAYLAGSGSDGGLISFSDHIRVLVDTFAQPSRYDAILIDARAGLHETTAAAVIGLGAEVLLFGMDQPQTFAGYELLLAHLATLPTEALQQWQSGLRFVHAKAPADAKSKSHFAERMKDLRTEFLSPPRSQSTGGINPADLVNTFEVVWDDTPDDDLESLLDDEDPQPLAILDDSKFRSFDPLADKDSLDSSSYTASFGALLEWIEMVISAHITTEEMK